MCVLQIRVFAVCLLRQKIGLFAHSSNQSANLRNNASLSSFAKTAFPRRIASYLLLLEMANHVCITFIQFAMSLSGKYDLQAATVVS